MALEMRERRLGYWSLWRRMRKMMSDISRIFEKDEVAKKTAAEMQKTVLMDCEKCSQD